MKLKYDPGDGIKFWNSIKQIPGYPKNEKIRLRDIFIESNAIKYFPELVTKLNNTQQYRSLQVVMDTTKMHRGSNDLKSEVLTNLSALGLEVTPVILEPDHTGLLHTEMHHILDVKQRISPDTIMISVGSGVITDITKHACYLYEQESGESTIWIAFQTANSVSAFTSNMAPVLIDGVKRTLESRFPDYLICDLETLRDAPREMTIAGVGDVLAGCISLGDWYLANQLGMDDTYNEMPGTLIGPIYELLKSYSAEIDALSLTGMAILVKLISLNGLAISLMHESTPFSGFEHVMSHMLDLEREMAGQPVLLHGAQVGLTTIIGAELYQYILSHFSPESIDFGKCFPSRSLMENHIKDVFISIDPTGKAGAECWRDYQIKLEKWQNHKQNIKYFLDNWELIKGNISLLVNSPQQIREILKSVRGPYTIKTLSPFLSEEQLKFAFLNAPLMRKRLTIGDILIFFNFDRQRIWNNVWQSIQT